jgi:hypothetical protein
METYSVNVVWSYSWVESVDVTADSLQEAIDKVDDMPIIPSGPDLSDLPTGATYEIDDFQDANL